ncbi:MAG: Sir2 family NAD-dependent protein deacetylase [Acidobacteriota bacterium]
MTIEPKIPDQVIKTLRQARKITLFTGAGISVAAGLPTLSGPESNPIWEFNFIEDLLCVEKAVQRPQLLTRWLDTLLSQTRAAQPTIAHYQIAALASLFPHCCVITQNVDDLHERAGSIEVIKLHGTITQARCQQCHKKSVIETSYRVLLQEKCPCGGDWRSDLLLYQEAMQEELWQRAEAAVKNCEAMIIVGSSGQVLPGGLLPAIARRNDAYLVEINIVKTELSPHCHLTIMGKSNTILPQMVNLIAALAE